MMSLVWIKLKNIDEFNVILENSEHKPALIFKHQPTSPISVSVKNKLELEWNLPEEKLDVYLVDDSTHPTLSQRISDFSSVENIFPQILFVTDGVIMYDESHEMISTKKVGIALKIINRTFKWMESRA